MTAGASLPAPPRPRRERLFGAAFLAANLLLSAWFLDVWTTPNPVSRALPALTWLERRTLRINAYANETTDESRVGEHYYSDKAPLPTFLLIPLQAALPDGAGSAARRNLRRWPIHVWRPLGIEDGRESVFKRIVPFLFTGSLALGALPFALCVGAAYLLLRREGAGAAAVPLSMLPLYGSFAFVYAGTFFNHVLAGALLVASALALRRGRHLVSGLALGAAFLTEYTLGLALPVWVAGALLAGRRAGPPLRVALGFLPAALLLAAYDRALTGSPWTTLNAYHAAQPFQGLGHAYGFGAPSAASLWGLTCSPSTGLLAFAPVLLVVLVVGLRALPDLGARALRDPVVLFALLDVSLIACFFTWWGGWTFGPRYLAPLALLLLVEGTAFLVRRGTPTWVVLFAGGLGLAAAWGAKATRVFLFPDATSATTPAPPAGGGPLVDGVLPDLLAGRFNANQLGSIYLGLDPAAGALAFLPLFLLLLLALGAWRRRLDRRVAPGEPLPPVDPARSRAQ